MLPTTMEVQADDAVMRAAAEDVRKAIVPETAMNELPDPCRDTQKFCDEVAKMSTLTEINKVLAKNNWPTQLSKKKADKIRMMLDKLTGNEKAEEE